MHSILEELKLEDSEKSAEPTRPAIKTFRPDSPHPPSPRVTLGTDGSSPSTFHAKLGPFHVATVSLLEEQKSQSLVVQRDLQDMCHWIGAAGAGPQAVLANLAAFAQRVAVARSTWARP